LEDIDEDWRLAIELPQRRRRRLRGAVIQMPLFAPEEVMAIHGW